MSHTRTIVIRAARSGAIATALIKSSGTKVVTSETAPTATNVLWFDPSDGTLSSWNGHVWVVFTGAAGAQGIPGLTVVNLTAEDYFNLPLEDQENTAFIYAIPEEV